MNTCTHNNLMQNSRQETRKVDSSRLDLPFSNLKHATKWRNLYTSCRPYFLLGAVFGLVSRKVYVPVCVAYFWPLRTNMTSSTKPEVHNASHRHLSRPQATENLVVWTCSSWSKRTGWDVRRNMYAVPLQGADLSSQWSNYQGIGEHFSTDSVSMTVLLGRGGQWSFDLKMGKWVNFIGLILP